MSLFMPVHKQVQVRSCTLLQSGFEFFFRGVNAIVYMVDAADSDKIEASRNELHNLLDKPQVV